MEQITAAAPNYRGATIISSQEASLPNVEIGASDPSVPSPVPAPVIAAPPQTPILCDEWKALTQEIALHPQMLSTADLWLKLIAKLRSPQDAISRLPPSLDSYMEYFQHTNPKWKSHQLTAVELDGSSFETENRRKKGCSDELINGRLHPLQFVDLPQVLVEMYRQNWKQMSFEPKRLQRFNPSTRRMERYFSSPASGDWWNDAYSFISKLHPPSRKLRLLAVVLYGDATGASDGTHHPVYLSLANIALDAYRSMSTRQVVALVPNFKQPVGITDSHAARIRAAIFQASLGHLAQSLTQLHKQGIVVTHPETGAEEVLVPLLIYWKGDHPEAEMVTCCRYSWRGKAGCIRCTVPTLLMSDLTKTFPLRLRSQVQNGIRDILGRYHTLGMRTAAREDARQWNYICVENKLSEQLEYLDVFQSVVPDNLHHFSLGIAKAVVGQRKRLLEGMGKSDRDRIHDNFQRMPRFPKLRLFPDAFMHVGDFNRGSDVDCLLMQLPFIFFTNASDPLIEGELLLLRWKAFFSKDGFFQSDLDEMRQLAILILEHRTKNFPEDSKTGHNTPKWHDLIHVPQLIARFGHPAFWDCHIEERFHIDAIKDPLTGNRYTKKGDEKVVLQAKIRNVAASLPPLIFSDAVAKKAQKEVSYTIAELLSNGFIDSEVATRLCTSDDLNERARFVRLDRLLLPAGLKIRTQGLGAAPHPRCHVKYADKDGSEYWRIIEIFKRTGKEAREHLAVVQIFHLELEEHPILKCPYLREGSSWHVVEFKDINLDQLELVHLVPDFSGKPNSSDCYFHNRFVSENFRKISIADN